IAGDTILATAHSEPAARGNLQHTETRATPHKGEWRLNGKKSLVVGLSIADHVIVSANTDEGAALFLVDAEAIQSQIKPYRTIDNALAGDLCLENTPSSVKLSGPEHTMRALANGFADALICLCSEAVGAMDTALFLTRDYLKLRQQFGSSLNNFQSLQHRMAEMLVELELSRSIVYHGIASSGMSDPLRSRAISAMKALVSSAALFVGANAVQLHGAIGMTEEYSIGHYYKRLRVISHLYGNEDTHLKILSTTQGSFWDEGVHQH
ncbi:MAG: acyl-CoA dehydrogenase, partial [Lacipirellulaceae bacterium]